MKFLQFPELLLILQPTNWNYKTEAIFILDQIKKLINTWTNVYFSQLC